MADGDVLIAGAGPTGLFGACYAGFPAVDNAAVALDPDVSLFPGRSTDAG